MTGLSEDIFFGDMDQLNHIHDKIDQDQLQIISKLFAFSNKPPNSLRTYFQFIILPNLYMDQRQIKNDLAQLINNLYIIKRIIIPKKLLACELVCNSFYYIVQTGPERTSGISFSINSQSRYKEVFIQIIPEGILFYNDFNIFVNNKQISKSELFFNSYLKVPISSEEDQISFQNSPVDLFFFQVLVYKPIPQKHVETSIRTELKIPNNITNGKAFIQHKEHFFKLSQLSKFNIDGVHSSLQCPICKEITDGFYFGSAYSEEDLFNFIVNDDVTNFEQKIQSIDQEHVFIFKEKCVDILQNVPSFLSLCATFSSTNCFNYLFDYYSRNNDNDNILKQDQNGRSVAHFACYGGDLQIINKLLFLIKKPDCKDFQGLRPIHYACEAGQTEVLKYLYDNNIDMFPIDNQDHKSPLHIACEYGHLDVFKFYYSIIPNHFENYRLFLEKVCPDKMTPLHIACKYAQMYVVKYILSKKEFGELQLKFNNDQSPLIYTCESSDIASVKRLINQFSFSGVQLVKAFNTAVVCGHHDIINLLVNHYGFKISPYTVLYSIRSNGYSTTKLLFDMFQNSSNQNTNEDSNKNTNTNAKLIALLNDFINSKRDEFSNSTQSNSQTANTPNADSIDQETNDDGSQDDDYQFENPHDQEIINDE